MPYTRSENMIIYLEAWRVALDRTTEEAAEEMIRSNCKDGDQAMRLFWSELKAHKTRLYFSANLNLNGAIKCQRSISN